MEKRGFSRESLRYAFFLFTILTIMAAAVFLPSVQGSALSDFWNGLTGAATSSTTTLSVTINTAPVVNFVAPVTPKSVTEAGMSNFSIEFNVTDGDGYGTINNQSAKIRINYTLTNEDVRVNNSCSPKLQTSSTSISYICNITIWYWDGAGNWTINVSINDTAGVYAENITTTFQVQSLTAMNMYPTALTWPTVDLGSTNQTSNGDAIRINNTGNDEIDIGGVAVTGFGVQGLTTITDSIGPGNFSVHVFNGSINGSSTACTGPNCYECNGTLMINNTAAPITIANITAGNNSNGTGTGASGQEELYFCIVKVPSTISRQTYDTSGSAVDPWTIAIS